MSYILNSNWCSEILKESPLTIIDGGARGDVFPPLSFINPSNLKIIRFDPDPDAKFTDFKNSIIVNKGLWENDGTIPFYITKSPTASSVYPVDFDILKQFLNDKKKLEWRETERIIEVETLSIDSAIKNGQIPSIDFIKLDIHGSEYQALKGAQESLKNVLGVHVETWAIPYYKGQKTHSSTSLLLEENGFLLSELLKYGGEKRNTPHTNFQKQQPVVFDCLYFQSIINQPITLDNIQAIKTIGLAELYGHFGLAAQLNSYFFEKQVITKDLFDKIEAHLSTKKDLKTKYFQKTIDYLSRKISLLG